MTRPRSRRAARGRRAPRPPPAARSSPRTSARCTKSRAKAPGDWVSEADLASEAAVREILDARDRASRCTARKPAASAPTLEWLVDPLDGTANFVHGFDAVGVSIGLVARRRAGRRRRARAAPRPRRYSGADAGGRRRSATASRSRVSDRAPEQAIVATGFPFRRKDLLPGYLPVLRAPRSHRFEDLRRVGAASLDLCWTAEGVFDGYLRAAPRTVGRRRRRASSCGRPAGSSPTGMATPMAGSRRATSSPVHRSCTKFCWTACARPNNRLTHFRHRGRITLRSQRAPAGVRPRTESDTQPAQPTSSKGPHPNDVRRVRTRGHGHGRRVASARQRRSAVPLGLVLVAASRSARRPTRSTASPAGPRRLRSPAATRKTHQAAGAPPPSGLFVCPNPHRSGP